MNKNEMQTAINDLKDRLFQLEKENEELKRYSVVEIPPLKNKAVGVTVQNGEYKIVTVEYDLNKKLSKIVEVQPTGKNSKSLDIAFYAGKESFYKQVLQDLELIK